MLSHIARKQQMLNVYDQHPGHPLMWSSVSLLSAPGFTWQLFGVLLLFVQTVVM